MLQETLFFNDAILVNGWIIYQNQPIKPFQLRYNRSHQGLHQPQQYCQMNFTGRHRCLVTGCCDDTTCGMKGLLVVASNNDYLSMDVGLQRGVDAISMNECLPIVSLATRAKDKRVFGVIGDRNRPTEGTHTALS
jgi:hypothetical protein